MAKRYYVFYGGNLLMEFDAETFSRGDIEESLTQELVTGSYDFNEVQVILGEDVPIRITISGAKEYPYREDCDQWYI